MIEITHLNKSFGEVQAVSDLSLHVETGSLFAFLGVNGAGKSTTIGIMCGQLSKDSGKIIIDGCDIDRDADRVKAKLGVVYQNSLLDKSLNVYENLESRAALYGITGKEFRQRIEELSDLLSFRKLLKRGVGRLSGGERRRIDIARALLHHPDILILDEPTTGLDPQTRKLIWDTIHALRENENITVFLTTHYMEEAADADYVVILDSGKLIAEGTPLELKNAYTGDFITLYGVSEADMRRIGCPFTPVHEAFRIAVDSTEQAKNLILQYPDLFRDFEITKGKMDDVFLAATGKTLSGGTEK